MNRRGSRSLGQIIFGVVLLALGMDALLGTGFMWSILLIVVGLLLLGTFTNNLPGEISEGLNTAWKSITASQREARSDHRRRPARRRRPASRHSRATTRRPRADARRTASGRPAGAIHRVAQQAMRQAGQNPDTLPVAPVDIGILTYADENATPTLYRETRLPESSTYIRPFMVLRSPRRARGNIRFELLDGAGTRRFIDSTTWELNKGETFVYPDTWLPLRNVDDVDGEWMLRIYAAGMQLAEHNFSWQESGGGDFRAYLNGDGEISNELIEELGEVRLDRLSLDDLLDDQGGAIEFDPEATAASKQAARLNRQHTRR